MRKFIKIIIIFFVPIMLTAITVEVLLRQIPNRHKFQANYLNEHAKDIETLIIGSSHSLYGINPEFIDKSAFNCSNVSQTLDLDFKILKHYEKKLTKLKSIIIRLSYTTLFEKLSLSNEQWRMKDYSIYFNFENECGIKESYELLSVKFKTNLKRIYEYYILNKNTLNTNNLGWGTDANSIFSKNLENTGINVAQKHTTKDQSLFSDNVKILDSIVSFCKKKNIELIIVTLPGYKSYTSNLNFQQLHKTIQTAKDIANKNSNCNYYNFLESNLFDSNDFFDGDHLNEKGSKKLSLLLNGLIKH